ncbi:YbhB/YbcL family Raf kinase inhibitor-like protein [Qipengyuania gaetbuli]|uniref:YbhB/YbcL family Raf kinase inhibitor-like protein n=1 Tax=Qipengyuania gaetbuli TaxID=266952 RepID=A0A844Y346_9SPHN|nr:YbhB/YbcL family Raf kinase inhibitor-like protein [Qipengyuania gaetbuli]MBY6015616.1 YbhB/YbcL family Raf kinase inhibitor-like protein [Qipengyuania gaetbuli]MXO52256.1 YbhB/YbcL family Raf kinase inhibitor-like protein [Qipengyuania gaetbuli]
MSTGVPAWIQQAIGNGEVKAGLTAALVAEEKALGRGGFTLSSPAFRHGGELDPSFTACEDDAVAPPLEWTAPPPGTQELVLVVEDVERGDVHWLVWGLPGQKGALFEGEVPPRTGKNARGNSEWLLPDPPVGVEHRYAFQLFALDLPLTLMPGATHADLVRNMENHVTALAILSARFEGHEVEEWDAEDEFDI